MPRPPFSQGSSNPRVTFQKIMRVIIYGETNARHGVIGPEIDRLHSVFSVFSRYEHFPRSTFLPCDLSFLSTLPQLIKLSAGD